VEFQRRGRRFDLYDTAGLRRRSKIEDKLEKLSAADALHAIRFAEVVVLLLDAERAFEEQDLRIAEGLDRLMDAVEQIHAVWNRRVPTAALNRFLESVQKNPPPAVTGGRIKLRYMTQPKARPPSFVLFGTRTRALPDSYVRYLVNGLREAFDLPGVPIRLSFREGENPFAKRKASRLRRRRK
jgi:GTP-binding protein